MVKQGLLLRSLPFSIRQAVQIGHVQGRTRSPFAPPAELPANLLPIVMFCRLKACHPESFVIEF